jgi:hypothetical protein
MVFVAEDKIIDDAFSGVPIGRSSLFGAFGTSIKP